MQRKSLYKIVTLAAAIFLFVVWIFLVIHDRHDFQNMASIDSLAMIHALFPWFWILLAFFGLLSIATFRLAIDARWLQILLLCQLSLFLYYTPFLLSGFSWSPDSLWHGGVASYMPEVLNGSKLVFSAYAESYPLSFMTTYVVEQVSSLDVFSYTLYVYPFFCIIAMTMLIYVLASRILDPAKAFVSMLFILPALHFVEPHVSPFSAGTILVLVSLILLTMERKVARALSFLTVLALILTHPISPVSFGIFLGATILLTLLFKDESKYASSIFKTSSVTSLFFYLLIVWFAWTTYWAISTYPSVWYAISDIATLRFLSRLLYVSEWTAGGQGFIYSEIFQLNLAVYVAFLLCVSFVLLLDLNVGRFKYMTQSMPHKRVTLAFSSFAYAVFGYALFSVTRQRFLLGRGLFFFVLTSSMCIASYLLQDRKYRTSKGLFAVVFIALLLFSFPVISYSKEAYNTFTPSSGYGLAFVASRMDLSRKSISMGIDQQLAAYVNLSRGVLKREYPPSNGTYPDLIVLRISAFFVHAMRTDLSFEDNQYVQLQNSLRRGSDYNIIYCSSTFDVYYLARVC